MLYILLFKFLVLYHFVWTLSLFLWIVFYFCSGCCFLMQGCKLSCGCCYHNCMWSDYLCLLRSFRVNVITLIISRVQSPGPSGVIYLGKGLTVGHMTRESIPQSRPFYQTCLASPKSIRHEGFWKFSKTFSNRCLPGNFLSSQRYFALGRGCHMKISRRGESSHDYS